MRTTDLHSTPPLLLGLDARSRLPNHADPCDKKVAVVTHVFLSPELS
jgi:hypothetical protein